MGTRPGLLTDCNYGLVLLHINSQLEIRFDLQHSGLDSFFLLVISEKNLSPVYCSAVSRSFLRRCRSRSIFMNKG